MGGPENFDMRKFFVQSVNLFAFNRVVQVSFGRTVGRAFGRAFGRTFGRTSGRTVVGRARVVSGAEQRSI